MMLSEAATSYLAHRALAALARSGARVRNDRLALVQVKKSLVRHLERGEPQNPRRPR